jgi:hypothetical protein
VLSRVVVHPFADLDDEQRAAVASCMRGQMVEAGETLATQGDFAYELFVIEEGEAECAGATRRSPSSGRATSSGRSGCSSRGRAPPPWWRRLPCECWACSRREHKRITQRMPIVAQSLRQTMRERIAELPLPRGTG